MFTPNNMDDGYHDNLADNDRIEGAGDLRKWRHSEVRLKNLPAAMLTEIGSRIC
jgi:hypothetical protein